MRQRAVMYTYYNRNICGVRVIIINGYLKRQSEPTFAVFIDFSRFTRRKSEYSIELDNSKSILYEISGQL